MVMMINAAHTIARYYFWNELTGDVQWEDPGSTCAVSGCTQGDIQATDVPYWKGDTKVWYNADGEEVTEDPKVG